MLGEVGVFEFANVGMPSSGGVFIIYLLLHSVAALPSKREWKWISSKFLKKSYMNRVSNLSITLCYVFLCLMCLV